MKKPPSPRVILVLGICAAVLCLCPAVSGSAAASASAVEFADGTTFRDIPGVTAEEIAAIERLTAERGAFSYGMLESSECFSLASGELYGYAPLLCAWLSAFFETRFEPQIYRWYELAPGIKSGDIDFSGDFTPSAPASDGLFTTRATAERVMRAVRLEGAAPVEYAPRGVPLRVAYLAYTSDMALTLLQLDAYCGVPIETRAFDNRRDAVAALRSGAVDMFIADGTMLDTFILDEGLSFEDMRPLNYKPVAIATGDPELSAFITVVDKAIAAGALRVFNELFAEGRKAYLGNIFSRSLTDDERVFHAGLLASGGTVRVAYSASNYPITFYDTAAERWDGLAVDVLSQISDITGLKFEPAFDPSQEWSKTFRALESGEVGMVAELIRTPEREGRFLWSDAPYSADDYALVTTAEHPDMAVNQVLFSRVGLLSDTAYAEMFRRWFPGHEDTVEFGDQAAALDALEAGEIDLLMTTRNHYSAATNHMRRTGFRINILFNHRSESSFGFGASELLLRGIVSKAQYWVDTRTIQARWDNRIFDYQDQLANTQRALLGGITALLLLLLALVFALLMRKRGEKARLELLVDERTSALAEQVRATEDASAAKSRFLANMSHEMRTPLNAIIGFSQLSLGGNTLAPEDHSNAEKVYGAGRALLGIVNDILDISKFEAGRVALQPVTYGTPSMINDIVTVNTLRAGERPIAFNLTVGGDFPAELRGDELRVKQIFNNLLGNAFKYTAEGAVVWELGYEREGDDIWLVSRVSDTGIGIKPEDVGRLFQNYFQADTQSHRMLDGAGLGLSVTKRLVELMDGTIEVESRYGEGSVFTVRLRQQYVSEAIIGGTVAQNLKTMAYANEKRARGEMAERPSLPYARVLLVDDMQTNLDVARGMMKPYNMHIDCAMSGAEAIAAIRTERARYSAVFMDHMMPAMDGIEALRHIRGIGTDYARNVPIIALTANALSGSEAMFLRNGFQAFLAKPIEIEKLDAVIRTWVRDKSLEGASDADTNTNNDTDTDTNNDTDTDTGKDTDADKNSGAESGGAGGTLSGECGWQVDGLDLDAAAARFGGDADALLSVLRSYAKNTQELLARVRAVDETGLDAYAILIHGIKGSSRGICAEEVGRLAEALELSAKAGDYPYVAEHNGRFVAAAEALIASIETLLASVGDGDGKPTAPEPDRRRLDELAAAAAAFDMDGIDRAMTALETFEYEKDGALVVWLRERVDTMELAEIRARLTR